jgi:hypothetical protein
MTYLPVAGIINAALNIDNFKYTVYKGIQEKQFINKYYVQYILNDKTTDIFAYTGTMPEYFKLDREKVKYWDTAILVDNEELNVADVNKIVSTILENITNYKE